MKPTADQVLQGMHEMLKARKHSIEVAREREENNGWRAYWQGCVDTLNEIIFFIESNTGSDE